ncbi:hypothetical protein LEP1GSC043_1445 [Leptospira weilii str. Ecochallenge]|uniref:Uncharacterized protein n=1 Tax=Leptospira weilii str. Ecochallenge TaxID=1049986 RepID=N1UHR6_9LEPT|nr:hypothetical protein LEP1GSC051_2237 [Leptospira sp. P2653]EMY15565.1 hypothetical protein LEP1GSC043_1445 [Leptospira weilii str. Ecochallenge]
MFLKDFRLLIRKLEIKTLKSFVKRTNSNVIKEISKEEQRAFFDRLRTAGLKRI